MQPTVGRIVHYKLSKSDADTINKRRTDWTDYRKKQASFGSSSTATIDIGYQAHTGNNAKEGDVYPMVVVRVWDADGLVNGQVLLDGNDTFWATSRKRGVGTDVEPGTWRWPVIEK